MKTYSKMLMAFYEEELNCFAPQGSWLVIADKKDTKKGLFRLPHYLYYFVSLEHNRMPAEIGVVKALETPISAKELAEKDFESKGKKLSNLSEDEIEKYTWFLEKVNAQPVHTPMAVTWFEQILPKKQKSLRLHKKFFTGYTAEEKKKWFIGE